MLTGEDLGKAVASIVGRIRENGIFVGSIRDYDALLRDKPPYIHETELGRRVSFQTRTWSGDCCRLTQYIIDDEHTLEVNKCEYRATRRDELTALFRACGCREMEWLFPEETGFYQPIVAARKLAVKISGGNMICGLFSHCCLQSLRHLPLSWPKSA